MICACRTWPMDGIDYVLDAAGKWHSPQMCSTHLAIEAKWRVEPNRESVMSDLTKTRALDGAE